MEPRFPPPRVLAAGAVALAALLAAASPGLAQADAEVAGAFTRQLQAALLAGPVAQDRLWAPGARPEAARLRDVRTSALFLWSDVQATPRGVRPLPAAPDGEPRLAVDVLVRGTAAWRPAAWGVARAFWTLQCDERREVNRVVRRDEWALEQRDGAWRVVERRPLGTLEIRDARLVVEVHPGQDAMLVEGSYSVRALVDGVEHVRFLLDRRVVAYDFRVDGELVPVVRGNELGSLGLDGFSPELESSFSLPEPLPAGGEAVVSFRLRSPLVHMTGPGRVTTIPRTAGAFRERLWLPTLAPAEAASPPAGRVDVTVRWPTGAFDRAGIAGPPVAGTVRADEEEGIAVVDGAADVGALDLLLLAAGANADGLPVRGAPAGPGSLARIERTDPAAAGILGAGRRERPVVVAPLLQLSSSATQDFGTELQELLPLDDDLLDELFDESATDAERGADDRSSN